MGMFRVSCNKLLVPISIEIVQIEKRRKLWLKKLMIK